MTVLTQVVLSGLLQVHMLVTGLLIVGLVLLMPNGILGLLGSERLRLRRRPDTPAVEAEKAAAESLSIAIRPPSREEAVVPGTAETVLRLEDISVQFRGLRALDGVNLEIAKGSISTVIGPNGAGKSTLFNVITGYLSPTTGEVWHRGERIDSLPTQQLSRRGIGRVFQISRPFQGLSVFDNVMVGALFGKSGSRDPRKVTEAALELTGLDALRDERASGLPVGHLRRLELARVIATRPDLILADEPCAGLNPTETLDIINILAEVRRRGATVLLVEHDMAAVMRISDFIYVIAAGAKIAEGLPKEIVRHPRVVEAYLGRPLDELAKPPAPAARGDDLAAQPSA
jgi:ABC-type branched-subunit amino acid transport system ATPase component